MWFRKGSRTILRRVSPTSQGSASKLLVLHTPERCSWGFALKLLSVRHARSIWLVPIEDLNPRGLDLMPMLDAVRGRYGFQRSPRLEDLSRSVQQGLHFHHGAFKRQNRQIEVTSFSVYNDGFVAETRDSTDSTDEFLGDLLMFLSQKYGLLFDGSMLREKNYLSALIVTTELELNRTCDRVAKFLPSLSELAGADFQISAIRCTAGPSGKSFTFEYEVGMAFEQKRFYSEAPVSTETHLNLLREFESVMVKQSV